MSLICVKCEHVIVMSDNPDHYGVCHTCGPYPPLTPEQEKKIEDNRPSKRRGHEENIMP